MENVSQCTNDNGIGGIPKVYWFGEEGGCLILVMERLGDNIEEIYDR
jgi:hypothetical protein